MWVLLMGCAQGPDASRTDPVEIPRSERTVGIEGGTLASDDGRLTLEVPSDALLRDVEISIAMVEAEDFVGGVA